MATAQKPSLWKPASQGKHAKAMKFPKVGEAEMVISLPTPENVRGWETLRQCINAQGFLFFFINIGALNGSGNDNL